MYIVATSSGNQVLIKSIETWRNLPARYKLILKTGGIIIFMKKIITILVFILCLSLLLAACGSSGSSTSLAGKWKDEATGRIIMEFLDDGTLKMYVADQLKTTATYKVDGEKITLTINGIEKTGTYKVEGNKLTLTESSPKQTTVYVKQ